MVNHRQEIRQMRGVPSLCFTHPSPLKGEESFHVFHVKNNNFSLSSPIHPHVFARRILRRVRAYRGGVKEVREESLIGHHFRGHQNTLPTDRPCWPVWRSGSEGRPVSPVTAGGLRGQTGPI